MKINFSKRALNTVALITVSVSLILPTFPAEAVLRNPRSSQTQRTGISQARAARAPARGVAARAPARGGAVRAARAPARGVAVRAPARGGAVRAARAPARGVAARAPARGGAVRVTRAPGRSVAARAPARGGAVRVIRAPGRSVAARAPRVNPAIAAQQAAAVAAQQRAAAIAAQQRAAAIAAQQRAAAIAAQQAAAVAAQQRAAAIAAQQQAAAAIAAQQRAAAIVAQQQAAIAAARQEEIEYQWQIEEDLRHEEIERQAIAEYVRQEEIQYQELIAEFLRQEEIRYQELIAEFLRQEEIDNQRQAEEQNQRERQRQALAAQQEAEARANAQLLRQIMANTRERVDAQRQEAQARAQLLARQQEAQRQEAQALRERVQAEENARRERLAEAQRIQAQLQREAEEEQERERAEAEAMAQAQARAAAEAQARVEAEAQQVEKNRKIVLLFNVLSITALDENQKAVGERWIGFGEPHLPLAVINRLAKLGLKNFTLQQLAAAKELVTQGNKNFTMDDLKTVVNNQWNGMTPEERRLAVVNSILMNPDQRQAYGLPANGDQQKRLKDFFSEWSKDIVFTPLPDNQPNLLAHYQAMRGHLLKAHKLLQYKKELGSLEAAKEYFDFNFKLEKTPSFPLVEEKRLMLYKALKRHLGHENWQDVETVFMTLLNNSLPMDHEHWPDFVSNNNANFDSFINQVIAPAFYVAITGDLGDDRNIALTNAVETHVEDLIKKGVQSKLKNKLAAYIDAGNAYRELQIEQHGHKPLLAPLNNETFAQLADRLTHHLRDLEDSDKAIPQLKERINYTYFCDDPFLPILRRPDQELARIEEQPGTFDKKVDDLTRRVLEKVPHAKRLFDPEFNNSFSSTHRFGLKTSNPMCIKTVARLERLYNCIQRKLGEKKAAKVIYGFGAESGERCVDGKRDRINELERQYVYVANGLNTNNDLDTTIGLNLAKLFMDHRTQSLRKAIHTLYYSANDGEPETYAWGRTHRALTLPFGLPGEYEELLYNYHTEGLDPLEFMTNYFDGGLLRNSTGANPIVRHNMQPFTVDTMADLVLEEIKKPVGGLFDDATLDYMMNSDIAIRKGYNDLQTKANELDPVAASAYSNDYFQDATKSMRDAIRPAAVKKVLNRYSYTYERDDRGIWK